MASEFFLIISERVTLRPPTFGIETSKVKLKSRFYYNKNNFISISIEIILSLINLTFSFSLNELRFIY